MAMKYNFDELPDAAFIDEKALALVLGVSAITVRRRSAQGSLPSPIKFSNRCTRWNVGEVRKVISSLSAA